ncbi:intradiol ring-cleavage dioxygenase [Pedobacter sp. Du54]|uniref:dioxygenase family protein n=1 Tax=Pedobacter anseongensis TaxID=3133439 RepID=UPI0030B01912
MKRFSGYIIILCTCIASCSNGQQSTKQNYQLKGAPCEGCEAVFEYGNKKLKPVDTLPDFSSTGPRLKVTGHIYMPDGKTPAADVILYIYHTDQKGLYRHKPDASGWETRHGSLRGWIKTDKYGNYSFYTLKPGTYPTRSEPAHIHGTLLEPGGRYYYLEEWHFKHDPLLYKLDLQPRSNHGGEGIVELKKAGDILVAERDIILGLNVNDYE